MEIIGTKEAFMQVISERGFAAKHNVDKTIVSQWKSGKRVPTLDKMEEILLLTGASVVSEKVWDLKGSYIGMTKVDFGYVLEHIDQGKWVVITDINTEVPDEFKGRVISQIYSDTEDGAKMEYILESSVHEYQLNDFKPIPISEDWLYRLGFIKSQFSINKEVKYWIYQKDNFSCILPSNGVLRLENDWHEVVNYVHELQQCYFEKTNKSLFFLN